MSFTLVKEREDKIKMDYLIVGAGLFGSVCARELKRAGKSVEVIDKRPHIAGNCYTEEIEGINVHKYGAHIFHTSDKEIWDYVNNFAEFNNYINSPVARYKNELYNMPFNMNTFTKLWRDVFTPMDAKKKIEEERKAYFTENPKNLEEQAINLVGKTIFEKLVQGYTEKQWGKRCEELPSFIIKRLPVRFTFDNNYFNDRYQGIPIGGYTKMVEKMLEGIPVKLNENFLDHKEEYLRKAKKIIYTGPIDEYFEYKFGPLEYRSVRFETEIYDTDNYQGNAVINYTDRETPYTRVIEHKHFEFGKQEKTVVSREYSSKWEKGQEPYYPLNDEKNNELFKKYKELGDAQDKVIFGGRLGNYKYYDMHNVIREALNLVGLELGK